MFYRTEVCPHNNSIPIYRGSFDACRLSSVATMQIIVCRNRIVCCLFHQSDFLHVCLRPLKERERERELLKNVVHEIQRILALVFLIIILDFKFYNIQLYVFIYIYIVIVTVRSIVQSRRETEPVSGVDFVTYTEYRYV